MLHEQFTGFRQQFLYMLHVCYCCATRGFNFLGFTGQSQEKNTCKLSVGLILALLYKPEQNYSTHICMYIYVTLVRGATRSISARRCEGDDFIM